MKKLIGALALTAVIAASAFAELNFGFWNRNLFVPVYYNGDDVQSGALVMSWGGLRTGALSVHWASDDGKVGADVDYFIDDGAVGRGDYARMWVKPVDAVKLNIGRLDSPWNGERGDLAYGSWDWLRPSAWVAGDEGLTFSGIGGTQFTLELFPIDGLHVWAAMPVEEGGSKKARDALGNSYAGASFAIGDVGKVKAQFLGQYELADETKYGDLGITGKPHKYGTIEAAFDLTGIDKLTVTVGGAFTIADSDYWKVAGYKQVKKADAEKFKDFIDIYKALGLYNAKIALGASYGITESLKLSFSAAALFYDSSVKYTFKGKENSVDPTIQVGAGLDFALSDSFTVVFDVRALIPTTSDIDPVIAFLLGGNYAVSSNGTLGIGVQAIIDQNEAGNLAKLNLKDGKVGFAVPIRVQVSF